MKRVPIAFEATLMLDGLIHLCVPCQFYGQLHWLQKNWIGKQHTVKIFKNPHGLPWSGSGSKASMAKLVCFRNHRRVAYFYCWNYGAADALGHIWKYGRADRSFRVRKIKP